MMLTHNWDEAKKSELGNRFRALPEEEKWRVGSVLADSPRIGNDVRADALRCLLTQSETDGDTSSSFGGVAVKASSFAVKWSKVDPTAAAAWVSALPDNENSLWVRKNLARNWSLYDPTAAAAWVDALPAGVQPGVRDFMAKSLP